MRPIATVAQCLAVAFDVVLQRFTPPSGFFFSGFLAGHTPGIDLAAVFIYRRPVGAALLFPEFPLRAYGIEPQQWRLGLW